MYNARLFKKEEADVLLKAFQWRIFMEYLSEFKAVLELKLGAVIFHFIR